MAGLSAMRVRELRDVLRAQGAGEARGIWSVCSAHRSVLEAAVEQAMVDGTPLLVESTSNQVNPEGGYTGQTPADFAAFAREVAGEGGLFRERLLLGGDHLGPHPYRSEPASSAMAKARELVRQCVLAGYTKLHLDASMRLSGDPGPPDTALDPELVTERAADLCAAAEDARAGLPRGTPAPVYVIGTDVPPPGGETADAAPPLPTGRDEVARTVALSREAFARRGLEAAWDRVIAVVVQPGVDFTASVVFEYDRARAAPLVDFIRSAPGLVYEAHSTDYQRPQALRALVEDRFAVLKVGPWLTFAFRQAVFGLEAVELDWLGGRRSVSLSGLRSALEAAMAERPEHWRGHHHGDADGLRTLRAFGYADRVRYYWPSSEVQAALLRLFANLRTCPPPLPLLGQYLPRPYEAVRGGEIPAAPESLVRHAIREVTRVYSRACAMGG